VESFFLLPKLRINYLIFSYIASFQIEVNFRCVPKRLTASPNHLLLTLSLSSFTSKISHLLRSVYAAYLMQTKTIVIINATGRQGASLTRVASAVGYHVRAQMWKREGVVAEELYDLPNVTVFEGPLTDKELLKNLFKNARLAFINTTPWGDEVAIGKAVADAAKKAGVQHYIYSSMPDHSSFGKGWPSLPQWSSKFTVENYVRQIGLPATFVYTGIYNNNFTSLQYPLFCMNLKADGSFEWKAPFHPDIPLPWLDAEHDVGPAVLQIFKDGPRKWLGQR
jgi:hypothetical protein